MSGPPMGDWAKRTPREALVELGPPLYVPAEPTDWRISGHSVGGDGVGGPARINRVHVQAVSLGGERGLQIDTSLVEDPLPVFSLVLQTVVRSMPRDMKFPWTLTVAEGAVTLPVDGQSLAFATFETDRSWVAHARVGDRKVVVWGDGVAAQDVVLARVDEIENLPDDKFARRPGRA